MKFSLCQEAAASSAIFIGKVDSVYPSYLDSANRRQAAEFREEVSRLHADPARGSVQELRAVYSSMLGESADNARWQGASSMEELDAAFDKALLQGKQVRLSVGRNFLASAGDRQADDDANSPAPNQKIAVWTGVDDCGVDFQSGETYLIYANSDEQTGKLETSACSRTRRLSDAAADLGYLYFISQGDGKSARIEGALVSQPTDAAAEKIGLVVSLNGEGQNRYDRSGPEGRFVFEGLSAGTYTVSVYPADFPRTTIPLGETRQVSVSAKTCATTSIALRPGWGGN